MVDPYDGHGGGACPTLRSDYDEGVRFSLVLFLSIILHKPTRTMAKMPSWHSRQNDRLPSSFRLAEGSFML